MLTGLGRLLHRRRWISLIVILVGIGVAGAWGLGVLGKFKDGGYDDPNSSSSLVAKLGATYFGSTNPDILILYKSDTLTVDDPAFMRSVITTIARLPKDKVKSELSYWSLDHKNAQSLASKDRHSTIVSLMMEGKDDKARGESYLWVKDRLAAPDLETHLGGAYPLGTEFGQQVVSDIVRAEKITLLPLFLLLVLLFGALGAASLPLYVALFSIAGGFTLLHVISFVADVNSMALEVVTMMGVGLAIDYSLFIISRYREEYAKGLSDRSMPLGKPWKQFSDRSERRAKRKAYKRLANPVAQAALGRTMATAGRTIMVSGITVSAALAGLLVFPQMFLRTIGMAGIATVLVAVFGATVFLPTLIAVFGRGIEFGQMPWRRRRVVEDRDERKFWFRLGQNVMKHPLPYFAIVLVVLGVMAGPFLNIRFGNIDVRQLPEGSTTRSVVETVQKEFPSGSAEPIDVVVSGDLIPRNWKPTKAGDAIPSYIEDFRARLDGLPGVNDAKLSGYSSNYGAIRISVYTKYSPMDQRNIDLVKTIRGLTLTKDGYPMHLDVGGTTAMQIDQMASLMRSLPKMAAVVGGATFLLLFMFFGSILLPIKAIIMNVLSIGASFGVIVWGFQYGHLAGILHFTVTDSVEATSMILILAVVFGLSMDYEVFLLSRIREEWDHTHDNRLAVARGMQYTGGIISSAAALFLVVIAAFSLAGITVVKLIGVGMFVAVVVDAALVRALLVPATMRFLGAANWWLPRFLAGLHSMVDLREVSDAGGAGPAAPPPLPADQPFPYAVQWHGADEPPRRPVFAAAPVSDAAAGAGRDEPVPDASPSETAPVELSWAPAPRPAAARTDNTPATADGVPFGGAATGGIPADDASTDGAPAGWARTDAASTGGAGTDGMPAGGTGADGMPAGGTGIGGTPAGGAVADDVPPVGARTDAAPVGGGMRADALVPDGADPARAGRAESGRADAPGLRFGGEPGAPAGDLPSDIGGYRMRPQPGRTAAPRGARPSGPGGDDGPWRPWREGQPQPPSRPQNGVRREIMPNPDGVGWTWRTVEDDDT
ncbi:MMPL family transporter [Actinomadura atramentaria]|uniref:MMPL family transporter n=1 Tax=Actinomadura atramentaria TaxID=1990 RepID=UPI00036F6008|nr:MMPL family transporter [Actinomadura atramentaria]